MTIQATGRRAGTGDDEPEEPTTTDRAVRAPSPTGGTDPMPRPGVGIRTRDRLLASDPGHVRLALASRAAVALALSLGVSAVLASVLGLAGTQAIIVLVLGAVLTMITTFTAADPTPAGRAITQVSLPLAMLAGITLSTLVDKHRVLSLSLFVVVMFVVVWVRRFGPRAFACGMVAWMGYFIALFLQLTFAQLPTVLLAVATTTVLLLVIALVVAPQRPALRLRRMVDSFGARVRIALAEHRDPALRPAWRQDDETARDRAVLRVNEAAVLVDGQLAIPGSLTDPARAADVRAAVIRVEAALARALDGEDRPADDDAVTDALDALDAVLDEDRRGRPRPDDGSGEPAPFTPAADLFAGFLPGSAITVGPMVAPEDDTADRRPTGMLLTTRQAWQISLAGALAIALGDAVSGQRWYWAVLACFLAFTGTATAAETVRKAAQRTVGTLVGVVVALVVVPWLGHSTAVSLTVILVAIFVGFYLFRVSYTSLAFAVTLIVAELYELLGTYSGGLLALRVGETALGAVIGGVVAVSFLPITARRAERAARARLAEELRAATTDVAAVVHGTATERPDLHARARALDAAVHQLALIGVPLSLRIAPGGARRRPTIARRLAAWVRCAVRVRALVEAALRLERTRRSDPAVRHERVGAATRAVQGLVDALAEGRGPGEHRHRGWEDAPDDLLTELSALHGALVALHEIDPDAAAAEGSAAPAPGVGSAGLCGRVTDERGAGLPAVVTVVDLDGTQRGRVHAAADGRFAVDVPDDGWRQLVVAADGYAPYAGRVAGGAHDVVLRPSRVARR